MEVTYLGCVIDETMSGVPMALQVINKINGKLKFLYRKNNFYAQNVKECSTTCLFCHILITHVQTGTITLLKKMKKKIQIMQTRSIRFCLEMDKMHRIYEEDFRPTNWLPTSKRVDHYINTITFNTCLYYVKEIFEFASHCRVDTRNRFAKL